VGLNVPTLLTIFSPLLFIKTYVGVLNNLYSSINGWSFCLLALIDTKKTSGFSFLNSSAMNFEAVQPSQ